MYLKASKAELKEALESSDVTAGACVREAPLFLSMDFLLKGQPEKIGMNIYYVVFYRVALPGESLALAILLAQLRRLKLPKNLTLKIQTTNTSY